VTWVFTVASLRKRPAAISAFDMPRHHAEDFGLPEGAR
jgi:hypothetical protein